MRRLRVVHVGAGLWGRSWAELVARAPGYRLVAVAEPGTVGRAWAEQALGVPVHPDLDVALGETAADVVLLASPPATHRTLAELALSRGCHVIVEKPLAPTFPDAAAIAAAAEAAGRHVMVSQNYRFRRQPRALQALVRSGALGALLGIRISCRRDLRDAWITRHDWRGRMQHPYLLDMAIHHVDLLRMITGAEVVEVDARSWRAPDGPFEHDPIVSALLSLEDGTPVSYEGTWAETLSQTSWNGDWELVGTHARATWSGGVGDALRGKVRFAPHRGPARSIGLPVLPELDRRGVLDELRGALTSGRRPESSAADNLRSLAAIFALARSTELRLPVSVGERGA